MNSRSPVASAYFGNRRLLIVFGLIIFGIGILSQCGEPVDTGPSMKVDADVVSTGDFNPTDTFFITDTAWKVPHDVSSSNPSQIELARFAWREFIALNWPSSYNSDGTRGNPDKTKTALDFAQVGQDPNLPLVWQTYMHRVELFPKDQTKFPQSFDVPPRYYYEDDIPNLEDPGTHLSSLDNIFNNLDETSEINLCTAFTTGDSTAPNADPDAPLTSFLPGAPRRVIYEAKANRVFHQYVKDKQLYDTITKRSLSNYTLGKISNSTATDTLGGIFPCPNDDSVICFPHGIAGNPDSLGSIEVKASWRQLSEAEYNSGRFLTAPVLYYRKGNPSVPNDTTVYYQVVSGEITTSVRPFGLVGLHIIHKTKNVPTYVFATFEQVDNLADTLPQNDLFIYNRNWNVVVDTGRIDITNRIHNPITTATMTVNKQVQSQAKALDPNSVWQYYQLIGTQGPANGNQDTTNFLLANIVTETNEPLANFVGTLDGVNGVIGNPNGVNVHKGSKFFVQGGCKGCHGNSQKTDFSFITANGPFDGEPDVVNQPILIQDPKQTGGPLLSAAGTVSY